MLFCDFILPSSKNTSFFLKKKQGTIKAQYIQAGSVAQTHETT